MWGQLITGIATAVALLIGVEMATKAWTGRYLHEVVFDWYRTLQDTIESWVAANPEYTVCRFIGTVSRAIDNVVCRCEKEINLAIQAETVEGNLLPVDSMALSPAEMLKQFPDLKDRITITLATAN